VLLALAAASTGCWEQLDGGDWFPQMKRQRALQPFEAVENTVEVNPDPAAAALQGRLEPLQPPDGAIPASGWEAPVSNVVDVEADRLQNPAQADLRSLENGRTQYDIFCSPCHGALGLGNGPVAGPPYGQGPLVGVLPLTGPNGIAKVRSDGHIYVTIRHGRRRMPNYSRIPARDRWDIVNYVRYLEQQVQRQEAGK
jgi:mono/diheme cytochrome c family protein